ncbi:diguanylate cyclase [Pelomonas sp. CA6]|uniref:sensor domain-containing diguanylate cyclase n=1 Tax=Pelomonas sp. CA6 TaxID=2907999 RepID=UPI001F4C23EA|nr:diguanylate cyclase [Pelomonas sp. CA6]MCH7345445.1 diguanylate cyclase [Pelomonas sp. CA6]
MPVDGRLLELFERSEQLLAVFDPEDRLRHANPAFRLAYDLGPDEQPLWTEIMRANHASGRGALIETGDIETWLSAVASRRGKLPFRAFEADLADGRWIWMCETLQPDGWLLCVASDITHLRQDDRALRVAHARAQRAAQTDAMTGLSNRAHGMALLQRALKQPGPLCLALLDLDHFKRINDSLGHAAGDEVIRDFARALQAGTRREDVCARLGGEEFMLLLARTPLPRAMEVVERLLERVRRARPLVEHPGLGYTCSAGLVQRRPGESEDALLRRADAALYAAKGAGRDRIDACE